MISRERIMGQKSCFIIPEWCIDAANSKQIKPVAKIEEFEEKATGFIALSFMRFSGIV